MKRRSKPKQKNVELLNKFLKNKNNGLVSNNNKQSNHKL